MSTNVSPDPAQVPSAEQQQEHLREVHEHLRHASTTDSPDEIRERLRRAELALQRHEQQAGSAK